MALALAAFALTVYLGLSGGGYDIVVRSELGLVIWWLVILGALIGLLPRERLGRSAWIAVALLGGFLAWSWSGLSWSHSHEQTLDSVCRLSTYLGTLLIGLCVLTRGNARALLAGLAGGIAVVSGLAVLSKLTPSLFPPNTAAPFYATARLSYPFDYADGVGEFAALGLPLLLYLASGARTLAARALAAAALPVVLLCLAMTVSRGGILAAVIGVVVLLALLPERIPRLPTLAIAAAGIAVLMVALLHRPALRDQIQAAPASQRHSMLALLIAVVVLSAFTQLVVALLGRRLRRPGWLQISRSGARRITALVLALAAALVIVALASGAASDAWRSFKQVNPSAHSNQYFRLLSLGGSHRYQYWQVAWHAFESSPLTGIGPGSFRFYWAAHQTIGEFVQNAHSLWFETLAEVGIIGLLLIVGFFAFVVIGGAVRVLRTTDTQARAAIAAAVAGVAAFCGAASFDWVWQIGIVPMVALLMAAVALSGLRGGGVRLGELPAVAAERGVEAPNGVQQPAASGPRADQGWVTRALVGVIGVICAVLIAIPLASAVAVRRSQAAARSGDLSAALRDARTATSIEPGAASPYLQQALVLEQLGDVRGAWAAIREATAREPEYSELWLVASRIATENGAARVALRDYEHARALDPTNTIFEG